jgi:hypothetical protein
VSRERSGVRQTAVPGNQVTLLGLPLTVNFTASLFILVLPPPFPLAFENGL